MPYTNSTKQALKHVIKIYFNVNIAPNCQRSRDTCVKHHPRSACIISNGLYVQVDMFLHHRTSNPPNYVFKFVFWCFSHCIDGFQYCRSVISVDGTHLQGPYKGILLIESAKSWNWFLKHLHDYVVKDRYIDLEKWTLLHDGGYRHGIMATNISEALNNLLKKARVLPFKALVEPIFIKLVRYFHQHCEEVQNCVHQFPIRIFDKFLRIESKSREHKVTIYNLREGIYIVRFSIQVAGIDNNVYTLRMNNKSCSCGKWQTYILPYTYVPNIYSRETYRRTYQANFHPVLNESF
ncbi:hypothetical protein M9H77_07403 [Catharanthus roseus]|uniref:Uncharacterized protein n=1 Tax=Catharanthus roseus TaxID=4058 RepID=A0ACC0BV77_CATRO|nr:hypothetical protein M9H77_07403 [Catharanthus roseus]